MSNGYLVAAGVDLATLDDIAQGFGLDIIAAHAITDRDAVGAALAGAPNIGIVLSMQAAREDAFVALLQVLAGRLKSAQLILVEPDALRAFAFLPALWPTMLIEEARERATALPRSRQPEPTPEAPSPPAPVAVEPAPEPAPDVPPAPPQPVAPEQTEPPAPIVAEPAPEPEVPAPPPEPEQPELEQLEQAEPVVREIELAEKEAPAGGGEEQIVDAVAADSHGGVAPPQPATEDAPPPPHSDPAPQPAPTDDEYARAITIEAEEPAPASAPEPTEPGPVAAGAPAPAAPQPQATDQPDEEKPAAPPLARKRSKEESDERARAGGSPAASAPADATAFAPKKLRRGEAELVRIAIHQPKDLQAVIKAARKADPRTDSAPQSMGIGEVALGASVGVSLETKGAACDGAVQRRTWEGAPLEFSFAATADADVKQVVVLARVFVDDAQIGVLAFTRGVTGPRAKALPDGERVRLKRHKRVFLSYSSKDRETVSAIATAYQMAGIEHFWDRASLKSGEEWGPRLRREIDRCDLFHLCWSKAAARSQWVEKETSHAIALRRGKKRPDITVQMLDGPPWAKHPDSLDSINFDDFVRAAIVGYARGDSEA